MVAVQQEGQYPFTYMAVAGAKVPRRQPWN